MSAFVVTSLVLTLVSQAPVDTATTAQTASSSTSAEWVSPPPETAQEAAEAVKDVPQPRAAELTDQEVGGPAIRERKREESIDGQIQALGPGAADPTDRAWQVSGSMELRSTAILDQDPANDAQMFYRLGGRYAFFEGGSAFLRLTVRQNFVSYDNESAVQFQDTALGFRYMHPIAIKDIERTLVMAYTGTFFLPTSQESQTATMNLGSQAVVRGIMEVLPSWSVQPIAFFQHNWQREAAGTDPQIFFGGTLNTQYHLADFGEDWGNLYVGASIGTSWIKNHKGGDEFDDPTGGSSTEAWSQSVNWDIYASYMPQPWLFVSAGFDQGGRLLENGIRQFSFFDRDKTKFAITLGAQY